MKGGKVKLKGIFRKCHWKWKSMTAGEKGGEEK